MHRFRLCTFAFIAILLLTSCQTTNVQTASIPLEVSVVEGDVEIQPSGATSFEPLQVGQAIQAGDVLRSHGSTSYAEVRDSRSLFVLGPNASVSISQLSASADLTTVKIELLSGTVLVAAEQKLGDGYFEVTFPQGSAAIHGSAMMVNNNIQSGMGNSMVTITQGTATFNSAGGSMQLSTGQTISIGMSGTVTDPIDTMDESIRERDPEAYAIMSDKYLKFMPQMWTTLTPVPSDTPTPKKSATPTAQNTWTPFPTFDTSTPAVALAGPTRRPTVTTAPGFSGLTPEEQANQGTYVFDVTCQAYASDCVCDSALANPVMEIPITFDDAGVTMGSGDQIIRYPRVNPNLYRISEEGMLAEITFLPEGWEFYVAKNGAACTLQTFTRR